MNKSFLDYILRVRLPLVLFAAIAAFSATFFLSRAERDGIGYAPEQPINFSHKLHAGTMKIDCKYCHVGVTTSEHATIPAVSICMNCHIVAKKNSPEIIKLTQYYERGVAVPWKRVHRIPDYAYFNHSAHVNRGIECASCHGSVENMDVMTQVSELTMGACLTCHRSAHENLKNIPGIKNGPENCATCHR